MLEVGELFIDVTIKQVIDDLMAELRSRGINYIKTYKEVGNSLMIPCVFHKDGQEKKPSCGIKLETDLKAKAGTVHCFTCGITTSIEKLISYVFGFKNDNGEYGKEWLFEHYTHCQSVSRKDELTNMLQNLFHTRTEGQYNIVSEEELAKYRYYHPYMYHRKLTNEIINKFDVGYDQERNALTFPVYNLKNECVFVAKRNVASKFFYLPYGIEKPIYALNSITQNKEIYVCESIINCLTLWTWGYQAVALLGTGSKEQYEILKKYPCKRYILCLDGDEAGRKGVKRFKENVQNKLVNVIVMPEGKDVNDLTKEEFERLKYKYIGGTNGNINKGELL